MDRRHSEFVPLADAELVSFGIGQGRPLELHGLLRAIGQALGGVIAQTWGLTAPWWFAFGGSLVTLVIVWRSLSLIAAAKPVLDTADDPDPSLGDHETA